MLRKLAEDEARVLLRERTQAPLAVGHKRVEDEAVRTLERLQRVCGDGGCAGVDRYEVGRVALSETHRCPADDAVDDVKVAVVCLAVGRQTGEHRRVGLDAHVPLRMLQIVVAASTVQTAPRTPTGTDGVR